MEGNVEKAEVNRKETGNGRERKIKGRENDRERKTIRLIGKYTVKDWVF